MAELNPEQLKKLYTARYTLFNKQPFFAQLVQYLKPVVVKDIPTMAVDANSNLYINAEFFDKLNANDLVWVLAHEAMHIVTLTHGRFPEGAIFPLWNIASDASINILITDDAGIPLPRPEVARPIYGGVYAKYKGSTTEAIYFDILKNEEKMLGMSLKEFLDAMGSGNGNYDGGTGDVGSSGGGAGSDKLKKGPLKGKWWDDSGSRLGKKGNNKGQDENGNSMSDGGMTEEQKAQWKQRIASAQAAAKAAGKMPGAIDQFVTTLLAPNKDWKPELRSIAYTALRTQWTWKIPGRRTAGQVRTPGKDKGTPTAICYIDTSGSQSDADIQRCLSETAQIFKLCGGKGHLILGDAEIYYSGEMKPEQLSKLKHVQRGGTDFRVLFDHIKDTFAKNPSILVAFTDCCGPFPKNPPDYPVVWCVPDSGYQGTAPWGRVIRVKV